MPASSPFHPEVSSHILRVTETAGWLEWVDWDNPVLAELVSVENGQVLPCDTPGNGLQWDEAAVQRYAVSESPVHLSKIASEGLQGRGGASASIALRQF